MVITTCSHGSVRVQYTQLPIQNTSVATLHYNCDNTTSCCPLQNKIVKAKTYRKAHSSHMAFFPPWESECLQLSRIASMNTLTLLSELQLSWVAAIFSCGYLSICIRLCGLNNRQHFTLYEHNNILCIHKYYMYRSWSSGIRNFVIKLIIFWSWINFQSGLQNIPE
jgi:hypothetical protein